MAAVALLGAASASLALATIPNNGVINACYTRSGGTLRVIDASVTNCTKNETALSWFVSGPPGPQGEQGEQGPQGEQGEPGESGVTIAYYREGVTAAGQQGPMIELPAGAYTVTASVEIAATGIDGIADVGCLIEKEATDEAVTGFVQAHAEAAWDGFGTLALVGAFSLTETAVIGLDCDPLSEENDDVGSYAWSVVVTKVGQVDGTPVP